MANPYSHTYDQRWVDGDATTTERLNIAREGVDYVRWALEEAGISGDGETTADWQTPRFWKNAAGYYAGMWIDNTATPACLRVKIGANKAAATPASVTDGSAVVAGTTGATPGF